MFVYKLSETGVYTVGHYCTEYEPNVFVSESDWDNPGSAAARVNYLNGGSTPFPQTGPLAVYKAHEVNE